MVVLLDGWRGTGGVTSLTSISYSLLLTAPPNKGSTDKPAQKVILLLFDKKLPKELSKECFSCCCCCCCEGIGAKRKCASDLNSGFDFDWIVTLSQSPLEGNSGCCCVSCIVSPEVLSKPTLTWSAYMQILLSLAVKPPTSHPMRCQTFW